MAILTLELTFISVPAPIDSGLGSMFNNVSCMSCHHNDVKGTPTAGAANLSLLFRVSTPGINEHYQFFNSPGKLLGTTAERIQPYTDLLLHDMGEDRADGYNDYLAMGNEWRTAPLWGMGLFEKLMAL
jgi:CxxC motif-containing protein (DUF1111 family)